MVNGRVAGPRTVAEENVGEDEFPGPVTPSRALGGTTGDSTEEFDADQRMPSYNNKVDALMSGVSGVPGISVPLFVQKAGDSPADLKDTDRSLMGNIVICSNVAAYQSKGKELKAMVQDVGVTPMTMTLRLKSSQATRWHRLRRWKRGCRCSCPE
jgi:hypothetical protein